MDQLPRLGMRELICLLAFTCNYVVFVWRGFLYLWVLRMGYVILLWHSLSLSYDYFSSPSAQNQYTFIFGHVIHMKCLDMDISISENNGIKCKFRQNFEI